MPAALSATKGREKVAVVSPRLTSIVTSDGVPRASGTIPLTRAYRTINLGELAATRQSVAGRVAYRATVQQRPAPVHDAGVRNCRERLIEQRILLQAGELE